MCWQRGFLMLTSAFFIIYLLLEIPTQACHLCGTPDFRAEPELIHEVIVWVGLGFLRFFGRAGSPALFCVCHFHEAKQDVGHLADGFGAIHVYLSTAKLVDGFLQQFDHIGGSLQRFEGEIGRQEGSLSHATAYLSALFAGCGPLLLLFRIVKKTIGFAGLGIGLAGASVLVGVLATGFVGRFWVFHHWYLLCTSGS